MLRTHTIRCFVNHKNDLQTDTVFSTWKEFLTLSSIK